MQRVDRPLLVINLLLLMGVVAIPFPTVLVADHLNDDGATAAVVTYGLVMIAISLGFDGLWIYVATHATALGAAVPPEALRQSIPGFTGGLIAYVVATLIALFSPLAALIIFGLLAVYYLFEHLPSPAEEDPAVTTLPLHTGYGSRISQIFRPAPASQAMNAPMWPPGPA